MNPRDSPLDYRDLPWNVLSESSSSLSRKLIPASLSIECSLFYDKSESGAQNWAISTEFNRIQQN